MENWVLYCVCCIEAYWELNACYMYVQVHICIMQVYFLLKIVLHCFFCLINWDPKVHRIDASHSHKSQRGEHFLFQIIQFLFIAFDKTPFRSFSCLVLHSPSRFCCGYFVDVTQQMMVVLLLMLMLILILMSLLILILMLIMRTVNFQSLII